MSTTAPEIAWCRAAILRETHQTRERQRRFAQAIQQYEYGGLDDYDFQVWKREGEAEDERRQVEKIQARKTQLQEERQAVKDVLGAAFRDRFREARRSDKRMQLMLNARKQHDDLVAVIRKQVVATMRQQKRSRQAEMRRSQVDAVTAEVKATLTSLHDYNRVASERHLEECRNLVKKIRAREAISGETIDYRYRSFDHTETGGHMLLSEMSLFEVEQRRKLNNRLQKQSDQHRREKKGTVDFLSARKSRRQKRKP